MRQRARPIIFVCSSVTVGNELLSKMVEAKNIDEAYSLFEQENGIKPQIVLGPFYKKRTAVLDKNCNVQFKPNQSTRGIHNGWHVTVIPLSNPPDSVYLLYDRRVDGQKIPKPNLNIVKIKELESNEKNIFE